MKNDINSNLPHIVIIGAGFGGLTAANHLKKCKNLRITLIDKNNYHSFWPFLYQVATCDLSPSDIAIPVRSEFKAEDNVTVLMDKVINIQSHQKRINTENGLSLSYDYLIIATGSEVNFFGNENWKKHATSLKTINDALKIKTKILEIFEKAELENKALDQEKNISFVIIGGGPTGVELAGSIEELVKQSFEFDFNNLKPENTKIILIENADRVLPSFQSELSQVAQNALKAKNIELKLNSKVKNIENNKVILENGEIIETNLIIWAAGIKASNIKAMFEGGIETGKGDKVKVESDLSLKANSEIFVIGDTSEVFDKKGNLLPGLAAVAKQQGKFVAKVILSKIKGEVKKHIFNYHDFGNLAIIGRYRAIAEFKYFKIHGTLAWIIWDIIHIYFLIGFRNRVIIFTKWMWNYITHERNERIIISKDD
ncbi:MAG: NAD(P)/FAD-dependent oxidoreductase [Alphaproteobacteria bacterium]